MKRVTILTFSLLCVHLAASMKLETTTIAPKAKGDPDLILVEDKAKKEDMEVAATNLDKMLVLNLDLEEEEEEIVAVFGVRRLHRKKRSFFTFGPRSLLNRRFDDYYFEEDHEEFSYENSGKYHDHGYQEFPSRTDHLYHPHNPYKAPDPHHDHYIEPDYHSDHDHDHPYHFPTIFQKFIYYPKPPVIRNPRDFRDFPGNEPAGVLGLTPRLLDFIRNQVNEVASYFQGDDHELP